jgi:hypothetical protein
LVFTVDTDSDVPVVRVVDFDIGARRLGLDATFGLLFCLTPGVPEISLGTGFGHPRFERGFVH